MNPPGSVDAKRRQYDDIMLTVRDLLGLAYSSYAYASLLSAPSRFLGGLLVVLLSCAISDMNSDVPTK